jgi:hypothetical protein
MPNAQTVKTTGSLVSGTSDEYKVVLDSSVLNSSWFYNKNYNGNGNEKIYFVTSLGDLANYPNLDGSTYGPLIDTLPEAPLAAALPLGMLAVWYVARRRRQAKSAAL